MPRDITVTFQDGSSHIYKGAPDNITPEQAQARAEQDFPDRPIKNLDGGRQPSTTDKVIDTVKRAGTDVVAGFGQAAAGIPEQLLTMNPMLNVLMRGPGFTESASNRQKAFAGQLERGAEANQSFYKGLGDKHGLTPGYGKAIAQAVGGGLASGGVTPQALLGAAGSGAGGELAARMLGDTPITRGVGGLVGGGSVAALGSRVRNTQDLARQAIQGIDEATLQKAAAFQSEQAAKGITVDLAQALEAVGVPRGSLTSIRDFLANNPQGLNVQKTLREQPGQLSLEADLTAARMPGANFGPGQSANNIQEAATAAVNAVKKQRSDAVKGFYGSAGVLTPQQVKDLDTLVSQFAAQPGTTDDVKAAVAGFRRKLGGESETLLQKVEEARAQLQTAGDTKSRMNAQQLLAKANQELAEAKARPVKALDVDTWIGEMAGPFKGTPLSPADPKAAGQMKGLAKSVNERFQTFSPEIRRAEQEFARLTETLVNPVKQSVVGQMATPRGYRPDVQAAMGKFDALLQRGTDANAKVSDIRTLGEQLAKVDKDAFADALKSYVSRQIKAAMEPGADAKTSANNPDMAARIAQNLWGDELKAQGLRDAVAIAAKTQGQDPAAAVRGLDNLMRLSKAMESRPPFGVGGMRPEDIAQTGGRNLASSALRAFGIAPFATPANRTFEFVLNSTLRQFDTILTSPDGAKMLAALGRESVMSKRIPFILGQFGAQVPANSDGIMQQ